ncbi:ATP-binding protein [Streptomyces sp. NBC_00273]
MPHRGMLDDYDFSFRPELDPRKVKDLATLSFVETKANAALLGPPGDLPPSSETGTTRPDSRPASRIYLGEVPLRAVPRRELRAPDVPLRVENSFAPSTSRHAPVS